MENTEIVFWLSGIVFVICGVIISRGTPLPLPWWMFAAGAVGFFGASMLAVVYEGPTGFVPVHSESLWGNQVWIDLLLAASVAYLALLQRMRAVGMNCTVWFLAVACSGSIGLLWMIARLTQLEESVGQRETKTIGG